MNVNMRQAQMSAYQAARDAAVMVDRSELGMLKITGETRLDLLNRMSTQGLDGLQSGEGAATILTTDIGRIIDRLIVYVSSQTLCVLTSENNADNIARYLMRFVFFQDDFHVEDISAETAVIGIYGSRAESFLVEAGFTETDLPLHHWRAEKIGDIEAYLHRTDPIVGDGYYVTCHAEDRAALWENLLDAGLVLADERTFELLRIESGLKRFGHELTSDYIPLEADLWDDVSFNKGCYTGQEIIARMESRGRLAKRLVKLQLSDPVEEGAEITANGKSAGVITSAAEGPNGPIALGFVRTAILDSEAPLKVGDVSVLRIKQPSTTG